MSKQLYRYKHEGALSGVCAGVGAYFNVDKTWIRLAFVVSVIFSSMLGLGMAGPMIYIILWVVLPVYDGPIGGAYDVNYRVNNPDNKKGGWDWNTPPQWPESWGGNAIRGHAKKQNTQDRYIAGVILLVIGVTFLLHQLDFIYIHDVINYWPVLLMFSGAMIIYGAFDFKSKDENEEYIAPANPYESKGDDVAEEMELEAETDVNTEASDYSAEAPENDDTNPTNKAE